MIEFIQTINWDSFWLGVVVTILFGAFGSAVFALIGEGL